MVDDGLGDARERAVTAAEALSAEGAAVTARAVRSRAQVSMTVAAAAAREWNQSEAEASAVPEVPEAVSRRFDAVWRDAVIAARGEYERAKDGWNAAIEAARAERDESAELADRLEGELAAVRNQAKQDAAEAVSARQELGEQLAVATSRADRAEARAEALAEERDRLIRERDKALSLAKAPEAPTKRPGREAAARGAVTRDR